MVSSQHQKGGRTKCVIAETAVPGDAAGPGDHETGVDTLPVAEKSTFQVWLGTQPSPPAFR